ncbi:MAG TPA: SpvB/TcaC N-terminal domain-containing protein [Pyrinomonadaceae bacterium]|nr:SpvB/TcaC N-terminal domain-containing protein [Pyrinomonadaceae bacterium]
MYQERDNSVSKGQQDGGSANGNGIRVPTISLPKGGGAIRGIGEKFATNPVTGSGSMSVPLPITPGRAGFAPQLSLSYDSGSGNGSFGFGWNLSLHAITRKTDKGLPQYRDAAESDVFLLSGAEDLVPELTASGDRFEDKTSVAGYTVHRYRPRIEGLFARIERWINQTDASDTFWRSISRDNVTTYYGKTAESRIFDPIDAKRIFTWLICESYDDKGNAIRFEYKPENSQGVDLAAANEKNRTRTAQQYLKHVKYGNRTPRRTDEDLSQRSDWLFELVFDYGEHDELDPKSNDTRAWLCRHDPFSIYRAGFEVRNYRLCQRVLMFHHFPEEEIGRDCLVKSTDIAYREGQPINSFIDSITQTGYKRKAGGGYLKKSLPPLEFQYSEAVIDETIREVDSDSLENLPVGLSSGYQWIDLEGEGIPGILTEQANAWFYKRNLSPIFTAQENGETHNVATFAPVELITEKPAVAGLASGVWQIQDLAGDGRPDLACFARPIAGFFQRNDTDTWDSFVPFRALPNVDFHDPNLRFVDLTGDGRADILITEDNAFTWYESLGETGFAASERTVQAFDEERGPQLVFADREQSIYIADLSGDGLTDLVRIRNGEVCYWPNLGYGQFGAKVTMDRAPWFDEPDQFDQRRIHLADIDGSGLVDIIYVAGGEVHLYFNQSGNGWSDARVLASFPALDSLSSVQVADLLGNGTACLVWSSQLPGAEKSQLRYIDLMGGQKPYLLVKTVNNLGAETEVHYAPSTKFYLADKFAGRPWITKLSFPVHVVEKTTVRDKWRQTEFSSTFSYHHGYFDGIEREFRGFGRVEQVDVESFGTFAAGNADSPYITNDKTLYQPPVKTITWFHTGAALDRKRILTQLNNEYFPTSLAAMPGYSAVLSGFNEKPLPEPDLDSEDLSTDEWREALRACKGMTLRQEVYELDVDGLEVGKHVPVRLFSAATHNCHVRRLQPSGQNRHAVFLVTESEALTYSYELDLRPVTFPGDPQNVPALTPDPRVAHTLNLSIDEFGNVQQSIAVGYKRVRQFDDPDYTADQVALIREVQNEQHVVYNETHFTNDAIEPATGSSRTQHYRLRVPAEVQTYQLTGFTPATGFYFDLQDLRSYELSDTLPNQGPRLVKTIEYHEQPSLNVQEKRKVEHALTLVFNEDLKTPLAHGVLNHLGLTYETYKLALTRPLLEAVLGDKFDSTVQNALDTSSACGYWPGENLFGAAGKHQWWQRSGIAGFTDDAADHFFLPERYTDSFGNETTVSYDGKYDLFIRSNMDALGNQTSIPVDPQTGVRFDYRVLSPIELVDINGNRNEVWYDVLGNVVAAAVKGKGDEGDNLNDYTDELANPDLAELLTHFNLPPLTAEEMNAHFGPVLGDASTRFLYHFGEKIENGRTIWASRPAGACTIVREQHVAHLDPRAQSSLQVAFECSDGQGSLLLKRSQAEPAENSGPLRWIVNGKTVLNNKSKPVKQYEPYFSTHSTCRAEGDAQEEVGLTPLMYYDAAGRLVRTDMPDATFSRVEFSPWHVKTFDANDTAVESSWYSERNPPPVEEPLPRDPFTNELSVTPDQRAAWLAAQHSNTPAVTILDSLGRDVISIAHNRVEDPNGSHSFGGKRYRDDRYFTFTKLDAEGKSLWIRDARGNIVMQYITPIKATRWSDEPNEIIPVRSVPCYDIAGNLLFQHSMDSGDRWTLHDAAGKTVFTWDFNQRQDDAGTVIDEARLFIAHYDALHRPIEQWLTINDATPQLIELYTYGEQLPDASERNLRGKPYRHRDQSGLKQIERLDFKGNALEVRRTLASQYKAPVIDWQTESLTPQLEDETFIQINEFDALSRMTRLYNWHRGERSRVAVSVPAYNERGVLVSETLDVGAIKTASGHDPSATGPTNAVVNISYNAKGQKESIKTGNQTETTYVYDQQTFRLVRLKTTRPASAPIKFVLLKDATVLQDLQYTYDPNGNITEIRDDAFQPTFFQNQKVDAVSRYVYDALYRLSESTGRENFKANGAPGQLEDDPFKVQFPVGTADALRNYTQTYDYDPVGNLQQMRHVAVNQSWTRHYDNALDSNRLAQTSEGDNSISPTRYRHDAHGNMLNLAKVSADQSIRWDYRDLMRAFNLLGGGLAYYNYDSEKQRTRKVIETQSGVKRWERIDLGGLEIYRRYANGKVVEEIESLHLVEGKQRLLLVDDVLQTDNSKLPTGSLFRYQYSNHLDSTCLELNDQAAVISYEEYHPYGTTAFRAQNSAIEVPPGRYRYTGMERDEETGLGHFGVRYYAPWLGRWTSTDPTGLEDGPNVYAYVKNSPTGHLDPSGTQSEQAEEEPYRIQTAMYRTNKHTDQLIEEAMFRKDPLPFYARLHGQVSAELRGLRIDAAELAWCYNNQLYRYPFDIEGIRSSVGDKGPYLERLSDARSFVRAGVAEETDEWFESNLKDTAFELGLIQSEEDLERFDRIAEKEVDKGKISHALRKALEFGVANFPMGGGAGGLGVRAPATTEAALKAANKIALRARIGGIYENVKEAAKQHSLDYQKRIARSFGVMIESGTSYVLRNVKFDLIDAVRGVLIDAKGPGYAKMFSRARGKFGQFIEAAILKSARRQLAAAAGTPIEWHVAEKDAVSWFQKLFEREGIKIGVVHAP